MDVYNIIYEEPCFNSRGKETYLLKGDYTSISRFQRLAYLKQHLEKYDKANQVTDAFKLCSSVEQLYGLTPVQNQFEYTIYSAVYDMSELKLHTKKYADDTYATFEFSNSGKDISRAKL